MRSQTRTTRRWLGLVIMTAAGMLAMLGAGAAAAPVPPADLEARALRLFDEGRYAEGVEDFRAILAQKPGDRTANILLSFALARQGHWAAAIEQTRQALALFPDSGKLQLL